ncbi:MAG TPA: hypothetical protein PL163_23065, partial [Leptospiraceae bacterium]|nr:hypothetical protein [Leptospiraceae bacterium]
MNNRKSLTIFIILILLLVIFHFVVRTDYSFTADSLMKAIQTQSLIINKYASFHLANNVLLMDKSFETFLFKDSFALPVNANLYSVFSDMFALISSLFRILSFPFEIFPFLASLPFAVSMAFLVSKGKVSWQTSLTVFFGSIIFPLCFEFSENGLFFLLNTIGFYYWLEYLQSSLDDKRTEFLLYSIFAVSLSVWFRLESILFILSLFIALFFARREVFIDLLKKKSLLFLVIGLIPLFFLFVWNFTNYGHILGLRYIFNYGAGNITVLDRIINLLSISFFYFDGVPRIGMLMYSSFFLIPVFYFAKKREKGTEETFLLWVTVVFMLFVGFTSPNNGITINGRYQLLVILPLSRMMQLWSDAQSEQKKSKLVIALVSFSVLFSAVAVSVLKYAYGRQREARVILQNIKTDSYVVPNSFLCNMIGLEHLAKPVFCIKNETSIDLIDQIIKGNKSLKIVTLFNFDEKKNKPFIDSNSALNPSH